MSNRATKGELLIGKIRVQGDITSASGSISAPGGVAASTGSAAFLQVSATAGLTMANVTHRIIRLALSAGTTGARTVAFNMPVGSVIQNVYIDVGTAESTASDKTIDIGLNSDTDSLLDGVSTAAVGPVQGSMLLSGRTLGVMLLEGSATSLDLNRKQHIVATGTTQLMSKVAEAQTEFAGDVVVEYLAIA